MSRKQITTVVIILRSFNENEADGSVNKTKMLTVLSHL